ncbi:MAG: host attachment protein [Gammaproteobacteria bacterium]
METTWILVADRSKAKLFESKGPGKPLQHVQDILHPEGHLHSQDIVSDKPGRIFTSFGKRHGFSGHHEPAENVTRQFTLHLANFLNDGRNAHSYEKLVLVAEPGFLGELLNALNEQTAKLVSKTIKKDLMHLKTGDLQQHVVGG